MDDPLVLLGFVVGVCIVLGIKWLVDKRGEKRPKSPRDERIERLVDRIMRLPKAEREQLAVTFEEMAARYKRETPEDQRTAHALMDEVLAEQKARREK